VAKTINRTYIVVTSTLTNDNDYPVKIYSNILRANCDDIHNKNYYDQESGGSESEGNN
jgi:hypothetical protein